MTPSEALVIGWTLLALSVLVIVWVAVRRDPENGELVAISPSYTNGQASAIA